MRQSLVLFALLFVLSKSFAQINYVKGTNSIQVLPYSRVTPNVTITPTEMIGTSVGCQSEPMSDEDFFAQPWVGNNQYLYDLLSANGYPLGGGPQVRIEAGNIIKYKIPIKFWNYRKSDGSGGIPSRANLQAWMDALNDHHRAANTGMRFYQLEDIPNIDNSSLTYVPDSWVFNDWNGPRRVGNAINVHLVEVVSNAGGRYYRQAHAIAIPWSAGNTTLSHEVGHFLALQHTFQGNEKRGGIFENCNCEPVDHSRRYADITACGSRPFQNKLKCEVAGDAICDTPADPQAADGEVNATDHPTAPCVYNNATTKDIYGDFYLSPPAGSSIPNAKNIMAYGRTPCRAEISYGQLGVMVHSIEAGLGRNHDKKPEWTDPDVIFDTYEPDGVAETARPFTLLDVQSHTFHTEYSGNVYNDDDWLTFTVDAANHNKFYTIKTQATFGAPASNTELRLFNAAGTQIAFNDNISATNLFSQIGITLAQGIYRIKVANKNTAAFGGYEIYMFNCADPMGFFVTGDDNICNSGSFTYTAQGVPAGVSISWTQSSGVQYISGQNTTSYTVRGNASTNSGWVKAFICGNMEATKSFHIGGYPNNELTVSGDTYACIGEQVEYRATQVPSGTYSWNYPTGNGWQYVSGQGSINLTLIAGSTTGYVSYAVDTGCGPGTPVIPGVQTSVHSCFRTGLALAAFPNPTDKALTINLPTEDTLKWNGTTFKPRKFTVKGHDIILFDILQREVFHMRTTGETLDIPTGGLPEGIYYLNIRNREGVSQRQIEIRRR